jgi:uncharacterized transporter YbjL
LMEPRVGNKYRLGRKIGSGSFGEIYLGEFVLLQKMLGLIPFSLTDPRGLEIMMHQGYLLKSQLLAILQEHEGSLHWIFPNSACTVLRTCGVGPFSAGANVQTNEEVAIKLVSTMSSSVAIDCLKCLVFLLPHVMNAAAV